MSLVLHGFEGVKKVLVDGKNVKQAKSSYLFMLKNEAFNIDY